MPWNVLFFIIAQGEDPPLRYNRSWQETQTLLFEEKIWAAKKKGGEFNDLPRTWDRSSCRKRLIPTAAKAAPAAAARVIPGTMFYEAPKFCIMQTAVLRCVCRRGEKRISSRERRVWNWPMTFQHRIRSQTKVQKVSMLSFCGKSCRHRSVCKILANTVLKLSKFSFFAENCFPFLNTMWEKCWAVGAKMGDNKRAATPIIIPQVGYLWRENNGH